MPGRVRAGRRSYEAARLFFLPRKAGRKCSDFRQDTCIEEARSELRNKARPALKKFPENIDSYDAVFVCYPNWWGTMPMPMFTFLEHFDWAGKKVIPLCTNEGSGMGSSERDLAKACAGAAIAHGLSVHGAETAASEKKIADWAKKSV